MDVGLRLRPDFCRWEVGGIATLFPVVFPNVTRRDPDVFGQVSFCHFWQFCLCVDLDHPCLVFSCWWSPCPHADPHLGQGPLPSASVGWEEQGSGIRVGGCYYAFWLPSGLPPFFFPCCMTISFPGFEIELTAWVRSILFKETLY